jgi:hypothetical protein
MADVVTPIPDEVATIVAAGHRFEDWESVFVQHRWAAFVFAIATPVASFSRTRHRGLVRRNMVCVGSYQQTTSISEP